MSQVKRIFVELHRALETDVIAGKVETRSRCLARVSIDSITEVHLTADTAAEALRNAALWLEAGGISL